MKLYEYMAKERLAGAGIPIPRGRLAKSPEEAAAIAADLGPVAVKAQVLTGGRGKAGGIRMAETPEAARQAASDILGMDIKGYKVESVYIEEKLTIDREFYLSVAVDSSAKKPLIIASAHGGVNIEDVPEKEIVRLHVSMQWGVKPYVGKVIARQLGMTGQQIRAFSDLLIKVYSVFRSHDAELVEINPLALIGDRLVAADARLNVDDDALFRHQDLPRVSEATLLEQRIREIGLNYVELDGDIAVMANGAGITMATLDVLQKYGGRPMNFLDAGGGASSEPMAKALEVLVSTNPKAIFINIFGGITRCDDVAQAIISARESVGIPMPLVVRLMGTNEELGVQMLAAAGIHAFKSMEEAAVEAVRVAAGRGWQVGDHR